MVVGVGTGLGLALVNALAAQGYTVLAAARSIAKVVALGTKFPAAGSVVPVTLRCHGTGGRGRAVCAQRIARCTRDRNLQRRNFRARRCCRHAALRTSSAVGAWAASPAISWGARGTAHGGTRRGDDPLHGRYRVAARERGLRESRVAEIRFTCACAVHGEGAWAKRCARGACDHRRPNQSERYAHLEDARGPDSLLAPSAIAEAYLGVHHQPRTAWTHEPICARGWKNSSEAVCRPWTAGMRAIAGDSMLPCKRTGASSRRTALVYEATRRPISPVFWRSQRRRLYLRGHVLEGVCTAV